MHRHLGRLPAAGLVTESISTDLGGRNCREYGATASTIPVSFADGVAVHLFGDD